MSENTSGKFPSVFGYIAEEERIALQRCVLNTAAIPGDALEVGCLNGLSALLTLSVLVSHKMMICVEKGEVETLRSKLSAFGFLERVVILNSDFKDVATNWKFSFVFIDHSHTYDDNTAAFEKFWPMVAPGGMLAFHDYRDPNWADGTRAIDDLIEKHKLRICDSGGSFVAFRKHE
jgi:predicted O-methyltransferase YrrM